MELSLTGIKMSIDLGRAVSIVADGIPSTATIPYCAVVTGICLIFARYVDDRHFQVVSAVGESNAVSALGFDCLGKGLM